MPKEGSNFIDRLVGKGTMQQRILKTILICVLIPMGILAAVAIFQISPLTTDIGARGTSSISQEGINALQSSASDAANWVRIELDQAKADLRRLVDTELSIFNGTMNITGNRQSYHANGTPSLSTAASVRYGNLNVNFTCADWGNALSMNAAMHERVNKSAYMDFSLKGISNNTNYMTITQVLGDSVSRVYPYIDDPGRTGTEDLRASSWYIATLAQPRGTMVVGSSHMRTFGSVTFPAVYLSMPLRYANGTVVGCIAVEYRLTALRAHLNGASIQDTGYVALIDGGQVALSHKGLTESLAASPIGTLEGLATAEFSAVMGRAVGGSSNSEPFMRGSVEWRVAYAPVGAGDLYVVAFVPYSELVSPGLQLQSELSGLNTLAIVIFIGIAVALFVVVYLLVIRVSKSITRPVVALTAAIENMTKGDLTNEIPMDAKSRGDELGTLALSFQNLLTTMRLGNKSYYRGDMSLAYTNYKAALELFETTNNLRGQAMSYNNLGNIYRQWADYDKAKESYDRAVQIGESQSDHAGLAARYNNRGLLFLAEEDYDAARADFERAMQIDKELGDEKGIATRNRNLGILNMLRQQWKPAQKFLDEALKIDSDLGNDGGVADDEFQLGRLALSTNDQEGAEKHFKKALKAAEGLQNYPLMKNVLGQLVKLYDSMDSTTALHKAEAELAKVNEVLVKPKEVVFVMDQSGSMQAEGKMTASRSGALEVFEETINIGDEVAIIGFHSIINPLLPLTRKKGTDIAKIKGTFINLDSTPYQTAFYDAVAYAIEMLKATPPEEQRWVVALTDGQDNMSKQHNPGSLARLIKSISPPLNFIMIGVGSELKMVHNEMTQIVEATPRGKYIKIYSAKNVKKAIEDAFKRVKEIMASSEIEGFTPE
ncbi:MAG: tetratricopeptide repeat protein [Candidatus Lokiarchaeota archaeon]|nr:tetratricopeptide repeat protein [Candidatus Lokiarchaeota archaeon]